MSFKVMRVVGLALMLCISVSFVSSSPGRAPRKHSSIDNLTRSGVVPDLIDRQPCHSVSVNYDGVYVRLGNELRMRQVMAAPRIHYRNAKPGKLYTIFMLDPDAPSRDYPVVSPMLHYMVINAPYADNAAGETLLPYLTPAPLPVTGYHRYVFLVYEQTGRIKPSLMLPLISRFRFTLDNFPEKSELIGPVAANYFTSQFSLD